jgi:hypothetical protein
MLNIIVVKATFDSDAGVWFTESADLPGLRVESATFESLLDKLPRAIRDLLEERDGDDGAGCRDVPVELIANASTRVRFDCAA